MTKDLDIVHSRSPENVESLLTVLSKPDAHFRPDFAQRQRQLRPRGSDLTGHGHLNFDTTFGRLDVLCEVSWERGFDELMPHTTEVSGSLSSRPEVNA